MALRRALHSLHAFPPLKNVGENKRLPSSTSHKDILGYALLSSHTSPPKMSKHVVLEQNPKRAAFPNPTKLANERIIFQV